MSIKTSSSVIGGYYNSQYARNRTTSTTSANTNKFPQKPLGLENLSNTCYISATLQILFQLLPETLKRGTITKMFFKLKNSHDKRDYEVFKEYVEKEIQIVQGWDQQDAQEFLISFLEVLNRENATTVKSGAISLQYKQKQPTYKNWRYFVDDMQRIEKSEIITLFYGELLRELECQKGHKKHKFERYLSLSLNFPQKQRKSTYPSYSYSSYSSQEKDKLNDLISKQLGQQTIEDLLCETCKRNCSFKKHTILYTLPKFLILHLARFKKGWYKEQKVTNQVEYDQYLTLKQGSTNEAIIYKLVGVVHHYGSINRGHYYSDVKVDGEWYLADDERVTQSKMDLKGNGSKYAYILFYQRQK